MTAAVPARLGIVTVGVSDLSRAEGFYNWAALAEDAAAERARGSGFGGITLAINVASEQEVDTALAEAQRAGASIVQPATRMEWGGDRGYFADPDGHPWEVAYNSSFPIDGDGRVVIP